MSIPGLEAWLTSAPGRYVLDWEQGQLDAVVADIFGFNALQIGLPQGDFLRANRIPLRQKAGCQGNVDVLCDPSALPFASNSTDLVILPHVLEFSWSNTHAPQSIVRYELQPRDRGTWLVFTHRGMPYANSALMLPGWQGQTNCWCSLNQSHHCQRPRRTSFFVQLPTGGNALHLHSQHGKHMADQKQPKVAHVQCCIRLMFYRSRFTRFSGVRRWDVGRHEEI